MLPLPLQISIQTPWQRVRTMMKSCWIIHLFLDGIFSKLFRFFPQVNSPHLCLAFTPHHLFSPPFWALLYGFEKHFTTDQFNSYTLHVFTSHHPSLTENGAGASATTCCVQRKVAVVSMHVVCLCVRLWKCVRGWSHAGRGITVEIELVWQNIGRKCESNGVRDNCNCDHVL